MTAIKDRSMESELLEGTVDGTYKRICIDRSNYPDPDHLLQLADRRNLNRGGNGYGVFEAGIDGGEKRTPDGRYCR
jgi:hypothetical protein